MKKPKVEIDNDVSSSAASGRTGPEPALMRILEGFAAKHRGTALRRWSYNSDVETVNRTVEDESMTRANIISTSSILLRKALTPAKPKRGTP